MSPTGRFVAMQRPGAIEIVDVQGTAPRRTVPCGDGDFAIAGATLCIAEDGQLRTVPLEGPGRAAAVDIGGARARIRPFFGRTAEAVLVESCLVELVPAVAVRRLDDAFRWFPLLGRAVLGASARRVEVVTAGRATVRTRLPLDGELVAAAPIFAGRLIAMIVRGHDHDQVVVITATGQVAHRTAIPPGTCHAFAIERGQLLVAANREVAAVDLRHGRITAMGTAPHDVAELVIDDDGRTVAIAESVAGALPRVSLMRADELLSAPPRPAPPTAPHTERADTPHAIDAGCALHARHAVLAGCAERGESTSTVDDAPHAKHATCVEHGVHAEHAVAAARTVNTEHAPHANPVNQGVHAEQTVPSSHGAHSGRSMHSSECATRYAPYANNGMRAEHAMRSNNGVRAEHAVPSNVPGAQDAARANNGVHDEHAVHSNEPGARYTPRTNSGVRAEHAVHSNGNACVEHAVHSHEAAPYNAVHPNDAVCTRRGMHPDQGALIERAVCSNDAARAEQEYASDDKGLPNIVLAATGNGVATDGVAIDRVALDSAMTDGAALDSAATDGAAEREGDEADEIPDVLPLALGEPPARGVEVPVGNAEPFGDATEHLSALLDLMAARAALAIAEGWHTGRISADADGHHPFEREVMALVGAGGSHAGAQLVEGRRRVAARAEEVGERVHATLAAGIRLPFVEIARERGLGALAVQILLAVLGPRGRGELGRLYRILGNDGRGPVCDDMVIALLIAGDDPCARDRVAAELAPGAALLHHGLVVRDGSGALDVDDALLCRLRGRPPVSSAASVPRRAERGLDELVIERAAIRRLLLELAQPQAAARVVVRGRTGSGRHALIAALAARVDRGLACIDAAQLPRGPAQAEALRRELVRAAIAGAVPVVSGLELRDGGDAEAAQLVRHVLRAHPGPLVVRTAVDAALPLDPGHIDVELPPLAEHERAAAIAAALAAVGIAADADVLARRYRIGPATIARIAGEAQRRIVHGGGGGGDPTALVDEVARQHVASRIGGAAQRVSRLATWDQIALPEDMIDSLRELIARARHTRTVFEDWGYDRRIATARGLTALFYGPPGTGKTMVAGIIARELGLELYRVDLAKVMSKWVGETEKNLGEVFDAAEDGRFMLLFDEADSLFARRSEVKSSNDRYANLEVNYLLQRLDAFEGVAILTTNLEGSIDPAFKRRLSMRLCFPFPDEELRAQLWAAHVTPQIPTAGKLDFAALARRFPLSGGYIRNSALRAAFLAAQERLPLTQAHLERAVLLEYRELGKLASDGRME